MYASIFIGVVRNFSLAIFFLLIFHSSFHLLLYVSASVSNTKHAYEFINIFFQIFVEFLQRPLGGVVR